MGRNCPVLLSSYYARAQGDARCQSCSLDRLVLVSVFLSPLDPGAREPVPPSPPPSSAVPCCTGSPIASFSCPPTAHPCRCLPLGLAPCLGPKTILHHPVSPIPSCCSTTTRRKNTHATPYTIESTIPHNRQHPGLLSTSSVLDHCFTPAARGTSAVADWP